jgi:hypothetical protein
MLDRPLGSRAAVERLLEPFGAQRGLGECLSTTALPPSGAGITPLTR